MVVLGLISFSGAKVAVQFSSAGPRNVPLFTAPPATSATIQPPAVFRHVAKAKTAVTSNYLYLLVGPAGDPPNFDVGLLE